MARKLDTSEPPIETAAEGHRQAWLNRSAARAFAASISAMLIAALVVSSSDQALGSDGTIAGSALEAGTVAVTDDDEGRTLVALSNMVPGEPIERCIEVIYSGTVLPVDVALLVEAPGSLARFLDIGITTGHGGGYESCDGFRPTGSIFRGTLEELDRLERIPLDPFLNRDDRRTYLIEIEMQDRSEAMATTTTIDLVWQVRP